jgi:hypothetical protein
MHCISCLQKLALVSVLVSITCLLHAQRLGVDNMNYKNFQRKSYYFGLSLGVNSSGFKVNQSRFFIGNDSISVTETGKQGGFNLNMIANLKMGEYFDFRFLPGFAFSNRRFDFTTTENNRQLRDIEMVSFELPFHLRFKSEPYKDMRLFVIGGLKYSYDVATNSRSRQANTLLKISPHDYQLETGFGIQLFYPYFIFSPEIKFSTGLNNMLIYNRSLNESRVLENVRSSIITISFHFEG